jgi:hypothetical protein
MKSLEEYLAMMLVVLFFFLFTTAGFAGVAEKGNKTWDQIFVKQLQEISNPQKTDGLGYTLSREEALESVIKSAVDNGAPPCEALKLAVALNFNPYSVLMGMFKSGAKISLNDLCLCATEIGGSDVLPKRGLAEVVVDKGLMRQAADDAVDRYLVTRDEVTQSQCLQQGLAYTEEPTRFERNDPAIDDPDYSP